MKIIQKGMQNMLIGIIQPCKFHGNIKGEFGQLTVHVQLLALSLFSVHVCSVFHFISLLDFHKPNLLPLYIVSVSHLCECYNICNG